MAKQLPKVLIKDMTAEMVEADMELTKLHNYFEALKSRKFVRVKTIANAMNAWSLQRELFWSMVNKKWPDTVAYSGVARAGGTIVFKLEE